MLLVLPVGDQNPRKSTPIVNYLLLAANILLFFSVYFSPGFERVVRTYGLIPIDFQQDPWWAFFHDGWKLVTPLFLHGSIPHLLGNMLFLWIAGDNVEDKLGHLSYLGFYLLAGVVGNVGHILMADSLTAMMPVVGASGAISGVLGAYIVWFPRRRIKFWYFFFFLMGTFTLPSVYAIGFWFVGQLVLGSKAMAGQAAGVAYWAHIGGFIFGALAILAYKTATEVKQIRSSST